MITRNYLISLAIKYEGEYGKIINAIKNKEDVLEVSGINCLTILDEKYPPSFRQLSLPPLVLFYKGNLDLLKDEKIGVVGSRNPSDYALKATRDLTKNKSDKVIVSGLAKGIDGTAHRYATKTIGILGCGIDYIYPYSNKDLYLKMEKEGLLLSEYPYFTKPLAYHFPFRNRLIAALVSELYIMELKEKSGTMTSVNEALELGKDVKVLPFDVYLSKEVYNNHLIHEGAQIISESDISIDKTR